MANSQQALYKLRGKVLDVYNPRSANVRGVTSQVIDVSVQMETGTKVRISFWNRDPSCGPGDKILVTHLVDKGQYRGTQQYSATGNTQIEILESAAPEQGPAEPQEDPPVGEPEGEEVGEVQVPTPAPAVKPVAKKAVVKPAAKSVVSGVAVTLVLELAEAALYICSQVSPDDINVNPQAKQAFFATIFIALSKENYFATQGKRDNN